MVIFPFFLDFISELKDVMVLFPLSSSCFEELLSITLKKARVTLENAGLHHPEEDRRTYFVLWAMVLIKASDMENCPSSYITGRKLNKI